MDPNANLQAQIRLAGRLLDDEMSNDDAAEAAHELAELVIAMNDWIRKGGFLPTGWKVRKPPSWDAGRQR